MNLEWYREKPRGGRGHGDVHVSLHVPKVPRPPTTLCGVHKTELRKLGTPFRGWMHVLCTRCETAIERMMDDDERA
jgi:hypothetical protein